MALKWSEVSKDSEGKLDIHVSVICLFKLGNSERIGQGREGGGRSGSEVFYEAASVPRVEDPANTFSKGIARVDGPFDVLKEDMASTSPILDGKVLDVDVTGAFCRASSIDHFDGRFVVFVKNGRSFLSEAKLMEKEAQVFGNLGSSNGSNEFSLSGAGGSDGLSFGTVGNNTTSKGETITGGRTALTKVISM